MFAERAGVVAVALMLSTTAGSAQSPSDFYSGKQVTIVVGYAPGGGYDLSARLAARFMGKHIPGNPSVIVQNMPGAGSLRAANHLYSTAPKDGLVIGTFAREVPLLGIIGNPAVTFDPAGFTWLGSVSSYADDAYLLWVRKDANVKSIADAQRADGPQLIVGGTGQGGGSNNNTILVRDALNLNIKLVTGYPGSNDVTMAVERKEVDAIFLSLSTVNAEQSEWLKPSSGMHALFQYARTTRHPQFPDVPTALEIAKTDRAKNLIALAQSPFSMARPFVAPPGIPEDRARALQAAFLEFCTDAEFIAESKKLKLDVSPVSGSEILALIKRLRQSPAELLEYMRKLQGNGGG
jgi:tripartite-type tricarboxylate transporter receptor subunit TctC